jgi:uncharacterized protein YoxC
MNTGKKQMMDSRPSKGVTTNESNEHRRNWTEQRWAQAVKDGNYDRTREHLNFEVVKGGKIQPIDKTRTIPQAVAARLAALGIKDPNEGLVEPKFRTTVTTVFGGNRERMLELAFGDQDYDTISRNKDHSHLKRMPEIEQWTKDLYDWCCRQWGEDNIVSFVVHLDEVNPHCHCVSLPITPDNKLSYRKVFIGEKNDKWAYRANMLKLHTSLAEEVSEKWGLARGDDKYETGAHHRSTEEYKRDLSRECTLMEQQREALGQSLETGRLELRQATTRVRALTTMVENKQNELDSTMNELDKINKALDKGEGDMDALYRKKREIETNVDRIKLELADKQEKLRKADEQLEDIRQKLSEATRQLGEMQERMKQVEARSAAISTQAQGAARFFQQNTTYMIKAALFDDIVSGFKACSTNLHESGVFEDSMVQDFADDGRNVMQCALFLMIGAIDKATDFAKTHGGGGGGSKLPWRRKDDEDDIAWARRCGHQARAMMKPAGGAKRKR